jgi:hypothetical protein
MSGEDACKSRKRSTIRCERDFVKVIHSYSYLIENSRIDLASSYPTSAAERPTDLGVEYD